MLPPALYVNSCYSTSLPIFCIVSLLMFASLVGVKWFSLTLLNNNKVEYLFLCLLVFNFLFCEVPAQLLSIFIWTISPSHFNLEKLLFLIEA